MKAIVIAAAIALGTAASASAPTPDARQDSALAIALGFT